MTDEHIRRYRVSNPKENSPMLVLSRKLNETICIGQDIEITVSEIRGNRIKLAISAPREIPVVRREVAEQSCLFALATAPILQPLARRVREPASC